MSTPIDTLMSHINRNYPAKAWNYEVSIFGPGVIPDASPEIMLQCSGIQIPGMNIGVAQEKRHTIGSPKSLPAGKSFTEINATFYESEQEKERKFFSDWINMIYNPETKRFNFYNDIVKTLRIVQFDTKGNMTYECLLYEAWPSNQSPIDKNYSSGDQVPQFTVNIQFVDIKETFYNTDDLTKPVSLFGNLF